MTTPTFEEILSLHRYFLAANQQRLAFQNIITGHAVDHGEAPKYAGENWNESWIAMSYWYGGLHVVIEGWLELRLADPEIDALLASPNVDLLRRYRNGIFHYQRAYLDARFRELIRDGTDVVQWVRGLNSAFGRFFLDWFDRDQRERAAPTAGDPTPDMA